jgi:hypothetical protein
VDNSTLNENDWNDPNDTAQTQTASRPLAYYNENDPFAAAWLRELIKAGHIAPGDVDERSIVDVRAKAFIAAYMEVSLNVR